MNIMCGSVAPGSTASWMRFKYKRVSGLEEEAV